MAIDWDCWILGNGFFYFVLSCTDVSLLFPNVNRINFLYYCVVCLCIISIGNFAIDIKPRAFSVWLTCHQLLFDVQRYGRLVRYQTPHFCYLQRIFSSSLPQSEIGYSRKDSLQIVGCSDFLSLPSFKHVKRQSDDGYAGITFKKNSDFTIAKVRIFYKWLRMRQVFTS